MVSTLRGRYIKLSTRYIELWQRDIMSLFSQFIDLTTRYNDNSIYWVHNSIYRAFSSICRVVNSIYRVVDSIYRLLDFIYRVLNSIYWVNNLIYRARSWIYWVDNSISSPLDGFYSEGTIYEAVNSIYWVVTTRYNELVFSIYWVDNSIYRQLNILGSQLPEASSTKKLCDDFSMLFSEKNQLIRENITIQLAAMDDHTTITDKVVNDSIVHKLDQFTPTTENELERIIRDCPAKTCSLDHCPTDVLKKTLQFSNLVTLVNSSFDHGILSLKLRTAVVKPLLKKDNLDLNIFKNYRPVSNIPFISKVLEKVAVKRLTNHLDINGLQEDYQSAYKHMHSTETALLKVKHDISSALDRYNSVLFVMLDLWAAFDKFHQNQRLGLLRDEYGITGKTLFWFSTYLEDRTQRVQVKTTTPDHVPLKCGVPQGSVLGPVNFTLYTALIQRIIRKHGVKHHKYADAIHLYVEYDPAVPGGREEACIKEICIWMSIRMHKLKDDKTRWLFSAPSTIWGSMAIVPSTLVIVQSYLSAMSVTLVWKFPW